MSDNTQTPEARPFQEAPDLGVITTPEVLRGEQPILLVVHDHDGSWDFLAGGEFDADSAVAVHLAHIVERHPEIHELASLELGWAAERDSDTGHWRRFRLPNDGE